MAASIATESPLYRAVTDVGEVLAELVDELVEFEHAGPSAVGSSAMRPHPALFTAEIAQGVEGDGAHAGRDSAGVREMVGSALMNPDAHIDLQQHLEDRFVALIDQAVKEGYDADAVRLALLDLAAAHVRGSIENARIDRIIAKAMRRMRGLQ